MDDDIILEQVFIRNQEDILEPGVICIDACQVGGNSNVQGTENISDTCHIYFKSTEARIKHLIKSFPKYSTKILY